MTKIVSITYHFGHFLAHMKDGLWGDAEQKTQWAWKHFWEAESKRDAQPLCDFGQLRTWSSASLTLPQWVPQERPRDPLTRHEARNSCCLKRGLRHVVGLSTYPEGASDLCYRVPIDLVAPQHLIAHSH